jgi:hypothetical protein
MLLNQRSKPVSDGARDFDFLHGQWNVSHRRLTRRLVQDTAWAEFGGTVSVWPILGGLGNIDDNVIELPEGPYRAATLRLFDPEKRRWSITWIDGRNPQFDPPMLGGFDGDAGTFFGDDTFEGRPIRIRFDWLKIAPDHCRWAQAFSDDRERSWEINWTMDFKRKA